MEQKNHEAFCSDFDYSKVCAPYVRLAMRKEGPSGDIVSKFDILFTQPNEEFIPMAGIHTLEHLTAEIGQNILSGLIDFSPMGCRTGFNLTLFGDKTEEEIAKKMLIIFQTIAEWPVDKPRYACMRQLPRTRFLCCTQLGKPLGKRHKDKRMAMPPQRTGKNAKR